MARDALESESKASRSEIEALNEFYDRAEQILRSADDRPDASSHSSMNSLSAETPLAQSAPPDNRRSQLLTAYRETVMATPAADELEEEVRDHMAAELGTDAVAVVFSRSGPSVGMVPVLKGQIQRSVEDRRQMIQQCRIESETLEAQMPPLREVQDQLEACRRSDQQTSFENVVDRVERLDTLSAKCEHTATRRQEYLQAEFESGLPRYEFILYLYRDCPFRFPVLCAVSTLARTIRNRRRETIGEMPFE